MIDALRSFRGEDIEIAPGIVIHQPRVGEIADYGERDYFGLVSFVCATPADRKVDIWDALHIFWEEVDEFSLFVSSVRILAEEDTDIILPGLDFSSFEQKVDIKKQEIVLVNQDGVEINKSVYLQLTNQLRNIHLLKKNVDIGADNSTRRVMIDVDRDDREAAARKPFESIITAYASCLARSLPFDAIWEIPIGAFLYTMEREQKVRNYDHLMQGVYSGCVDAKKIKKSDLNWLGKLR